MTKAKLILNKLARGEYEIGVSTDDGAIVARVSVWDGTAPDRRGEDEKREAAMAKASRLARAFSDTVNP
jgi:hypothetical protein